MPTINLPKDILSFMKELTKYFMDFLETDFHKRRNPKRNIQVHNKSNLLIGLNINKYPTFSKLVWKKINSGFGINTVIEIPKSTYRSNIPQNLIDLVKYQLGKINNTQISKIISDVSTAVEKTAILYKKDYDQALSVSIDEVSKIILKELVLPFVTNLERPLENTGLGDENDVFLMEEELTSVLSYQIENKVSEILKLILAENKVDVEKELKTVISLEDVKTSIVSFFEDFKVGDLFAEISEMERNRSILDKQEFYLYFCDVTFEKVKYPIFYIPFTLIKSTEKLIVNFESQVYVNKKALEFIVQQYNTIKGTKGNLQTINERIIYLAQHENDLVGVLEEILRSIVNIFDLDKEIKLSVEANQVAKSFLVRSSNSSYIAIFDKSDEALVNDYEEILKMLGEGNSAITDAFHKLIGDFIYSDPQSFNGVVENEWDEEPITERLVSNSPIPLNSEQRQILRALNQEGCKYISVEGPPGTGKSHTITAIVFNMILDGKSVLVLSDKKEALDVVEDKITDTLNKARNDKNFQNPILRLGKTGNTYSQILSAGSLESIKTHFRAVKNTYKDIKLEIEKRGNSLKDELQAEILAGDDVKISEILKLIKLESFYGINGFPFEIDESLNKPETVADFKKLRSTLLLLSETLCKFEFDHPINLKPTQKNTDDTTTLISYLEKYISFINDHPDWEEAEKIALRIYENNIDVKLTKSDWGEFVDLDKMLNDDFIACSNFGLPKPKTFVEDFEWLEGLSWLIDVVDSLYRELTLKEIDEIRKPLEVNDANCEHLQLFARHYEELKKPIIGYLFSGKQLKEANESFNKVFEVKVFSRPEQKIAVLKSLNKIVEVIRKNKLKAPKIFMSLDLVKSVFSIVRNDKTNIGIKNIIVVLNKLKLLIQKHESADWYKIIQPKDFIELENIYSAHKINESFKKYIDIAGNVELLKIKNFKDFLNKNRVIDKKEELVTFFDYLKLIIEVNSEIKSVIKITNTYPCISKKIDLNTGVKSFLKNEIIKISEIDYSRFLTYLDLKIKIHKDFENLPDLNFNGHTKYIEELVTVQMTYLLDERVISFNENNRSTAKTLSEIIKSKRKFPRDEFSKLKQAFPCILAGIRDYAEYIPLEPEIFDLVIIDEASQVSVSQAFPALLRAKKVLVLGDKKQFSNVKSAQARSDTNREYLNGLKDAFVKSVSDEGSKLVKLEKFDIKTSILEFFQFINNYQTQLLKHFRGYKEIISYSNKYFYRDNLQVMKIRGKNIDEVLKFTVLKDNNLVEVLPKSNLAEVEFIIGELKRLKESGVQVSVGIITPHTNQQKLISDKISKLDDESYYYENMNLKIMTFDTCQGEERDIVFYSMVATDISDRLWGVFIKDLESVDVEEDGKIKAQRLNVGLSRAKECMHFVLSKEVENYTGSIGQALRHYSSILNEAKKEKTAKDTDANSKMEEKVLAWFYQTDFWEKHKDRVDVRPQFELGKYLKQLDKSYEHPNYKVDFLLICRDKGNKEFKLVLEYDGFEEHFQGLEEVNELNYEDYYSEDDVYRQKVLEGYGYKFIRINKFNVGKNPVETLNGRIRTALNSFFNPNHRINEIKATVQNLDNGQMKECRKCKKIKDLKEYVDPALIGYGRICRSCKSLYFARRY
jgi:superfamily I DNA and/or RNA helicase/very-short-patch-repair endonuclease